MMARYLVTWEIDYEKARAAELHRVDVHAHDAPRRPSASRKRPKDAHRPATQVKAVPAFHRAEAIEPRLCLRLPDARLEAERARLARVLSCG